MRAPYVVVACALVALTGVFIALAVGNAAAVRPLADPGAVVRYGLPILKLGVNLSVAVVIGALALALWAFAATERAYRRLIDIAASAAILLTLFSLLTLIFIYLDVSGQPFSFDESFGSGLALFVTKIALGQGWLWIVILSALTALLALVVTNQTALFFVGLVAMTPLLPLALMGHSAAASGHDIAMTSLGIHLVFVAIWLGGLVALVLVRKRVEPADSVS